MRFGKAEGASTDRQAQRGAGEGNEPMSRNCLGSCLIQILIMVAVVFCLVWFVLPIGVGALATAVLNSSGFSGTGTKVEVSASPPFMLLTGHADTIRIRSTQARMGDLHAGTVDVTLGQVDLLGRSFGTVNGTLGTVEVAAPNGDPVNIDSVTLKGTGQATTATATMGIAAAQALAESQLKAQTGIAGKVMLKGPNQVTLTVNGKSQAARLVVTNGSLILVPTSKALPSVTLIAPGVGNPLHVTSVNIGLANVTLVGTIDTQAMLS
jgi:hypothetical protein